MIKKDHRVKITFIIWKNINNIEVFYLCRPLTLKGLGPDLYSSNICLFLSFTMLPFPMMNSNLSVSHRAITKIQSSQFLVMETRLVPCFFVKGVTKYKY